MLKSIKKEWKKNWILYVMILPVVVYFLVFHYVPMYGVTLAFKDYKIKLGIMDSPWAGLKYFQKFFNLYNFKQILMNTLGISVYSLVVGFPLPIVFALMLNYLRSMKLKKVVQMVSYAPHFISTVVICGMISLFFAPDTGVINVLRDIIGLDSVNFLAKPEYFKSIYVWTGVWQNLGWSAVIYTSALAGVDSQMHEAAIIDGATKVQRMIHIDIPSITPTIAMLLVLKMGQLMSVGFEKIYLLQNSLNYNSSVTISTYVYEVGLLDMNYSFSTAIGLFNNVVNVILLVSANTFSKKVIKESLW